MHDHWLNRFLARHGMLCEKTGRFRLASRSRGKVALLFPLIGLFSLVWFLIRVVPKPSRASYPCMRAAAPLASSFITWLAGIFVVPAVMVNASGALRRLPGAIRHRVLLAFVGLALVFGSSVFVCQSGGAGFTNAVIEQANKPLGTGIGIFPGRVVWVWDPQATNERLTNRPGDGWFLPKNNNQPAVDRMLSEGMRALTGMDSDAAAWDAVFRFHNGKTRADKKAAAGYTRGQKIFIKINATSAWTGNYDSADLSVKANKLYGIAETNPALVLAVLRQLIGTVGVDQKDIYVGDPMKRIYRHSFELWHEEFPAVHYLDKSFGAELGRERAAFTVRPVIHYSDRGKVMKAGSWSDPDSGPPTIEDRLCTLFETADYLINIPALKGHKRAGVSMFPKNHFGSNGRDDARHLHGGLVNPSEKNALRQDYGQYRVLVDLMGHVWLGGKNLFYLLDALYAGPEAVYPPTRWQSAPFNGDWTSSLFLSLDPVAIESVGYDFLRSEYTAETPYNWVQMRGVDDYLHQAADPSAWPSGIVYDPENDGTPLESLGVHEHWNNAQEKRYSRNLGGKAGIDLFRAGAGFAAPP